MKFSYSWLKEFLPKLDIVSEDLPDRLTMAGFENESVSVCSSLGDKVLVGYVLECLPHPNSDRLKLCQVDVGDEEPLSIICGAANARSGIMVVCALVGALLPNGLLIKKREIRGVVSSGMLCSADEIGLPYSSNGILELPLDHGLVGNTFDSVCPPDIWFDVSVLSNRPDCLSVWGISREIGAWSRNFDIWIPSDYRDWDQAPDVSRSRLGIESANDCSVYYGAAIEDINLDSPLPFFITHRLLASGLKPVNSLVDILNYSLLTWGQPFHAFDADKLAGNKIFIRRASSLETITTISLNEQKLDDRFIVVADSNKPQAIAGLIGGIESAISSQTKSVFIEAACFNPSVCAVQARLSNIITDSGFRFERGVDSRSTLTVFKHVLHLVKKICGGILKEKVCHHIVDTSIKSSLVVDEGIVNSLIGFSLDREMISDLLFRAGLPNHKQRTGQLVVSIPSWRFDISSQEDLVEEVARIYGYENVPDKFPSFVHDNFFTDRQSLDKVKSSLVSSGYQEVFTYSFSDPKKQRWDSKKDFVSIANPMTKSMSIMRSEILPSLLDVLEHNVRHGVTRLKIFESSVCFYKHENTVRETNKVAGLCYGPLFPEQWGHDSDREVDLFDVKGDIERAVSASFEYRKEDNDFFHPAGVSSLVQNGKAIGIVGVLHPRFKKTLNLLYLPVLFEFYHDNFCMADRLTYQEFSVNPKVVRDLCFWVPADLPFQDIFDQLS
ncbi:phenylalanine--tRNA ligase subunit beta, partial [Candidatus Ichthyocystis hellenicum]|uniref:phenylalanine--tRNA ligase subunit beta n=1 Tax=Candidatus Ichthyocystis hellenicum TaxID=1561003 RepID=UPI000B809D48